MESSLRTLLDIGVKMETVLDVGAKDCTWPLRKVFPDRHHHLFEPVDLYFDKLHENYRDISHTLHPVALSDTDGEGFLALVDRDGDGKFNSQVVDASAVSQFKKHVKIRLERLDTVVKREQLKGPFLLKIDTDGHEYPVLRGADRILPAVSVIVVEVILDKMNEAVFSEQSQYLIERGFFLKDIVDPLYYDEVLWQVDFIYVRGEATSVLDRLWPYKKANFQVEKNKWYAP